MSAIDPRFAARRREVRERSARHRLRWVLVAMLLAALGALGWWVAHSPLLAVTSIDVQGMERDAAIRLAAEGGLEEGVSTLWLRPGRIEAALRADPWVADARVSIEYPHTVALTVLLHDPVAAVQASDGSWMAITEGGAVVAHLEEPAGRAAVTGAGLSLVRPGTVIGAPEVVAAAAFAAALPDGLDVNLNLEGTLIAGVVAGHPVMVGRPNRIADKAAAVAALLGAGIPEGAEIDVVAPDRPAVRVPEAAAAEGTLDSGSSEDGGE